ncbi:MAG: hypothetical protein JWM33_2365 [Caulobacteraceae bacterium]|nr:hypothetical protein [Caulobacteraceae bacterium]
MKRLLTIAAVSLAAASAAMALAALPARAETLYFDIPASEAAVGLSAWSARSGIKIDVSQGMIAGATTHAVKGEIDAREALRLMLDDSMTIVSDDGKTVALGPSIAWQMDDVPARADPQRDAYQQRVQAVLAAAFAPQVIARLVVEPSSRNEYAIGLKLEAGVYSIVSVRSSVAISGYSRGVSKPSGSRPAGVAKPRLCSAKVVPELGDRLSAAWRDVVGLNAPKSLIDTEGVDYAFASPATDHDRVRHVRDPLEGTIEGGLAAVAQAMADYCDHPLLKKAALNTRLKVLQGRLARRSPPDDEDRILPYGCDDLVVAGRIRNEGDYQSAAIPNDPIGHGWMNAEIVVARVLKGKDVPGRLSVRYLGHTFFREDVDLMFVIHRGQDGANEVEATQVVSMLPRLAAHCD